MTGSPRPQTSTPRTLVLIAGVALMNALAACGGDRPDRQVTRLEAIQAEQQGGRVTISGDDAQAHVLNWRAPQVNLDQGQIADARSRADAARRAGKLYEDAESAIPLYLAILRIAPSDVRSQRGLARAVGSLLDALRAGLPEAEDDPAARRQLHTLAAVARAVAPSDPRLGELLAQVDLMDRTWALNEQAEAELNAGRFGAQGGGALAGFREVLRLVPGQARALQGVAAAESGLIRTAEEAAARGDFSAAIRWVELAAQVRPGSPTIGDARARLETARLLRMNSLRDAGLRVLGEYGGVRKARDYLAQMLRIARPGDAAAAELRTRIDLATHYGSFKPGQMFTDALRNGGSGPQMIVVPHGAFRMGADLGDPDAEDYEQPARYLRFDKGFAMARDEVTVREFRRYLKATGARSRAMRRGYSMAYEERSGNFVRRSKVDTSSDYLGDPADDDLPVLHVSAADADAYAKWLTAQTGRSYRLPSEAEFEYALRAGSTSRFPWGDAPRPPARAANVTGALDRSPAGRRWRNAFADYADGFWGPAPVGSYRANAFGVYDLAGNVSEWVADCWHDSYRRAPKTPQAWFNPGCRTRVIRGGAWASAPQQLRSIWRAPLERDTTNAQIGFRVVRDL